MKKQHEYPIMFAERNENIIYIAGNSSWNIKELGSIERIDLRDSKGWEIYDNSICNLYHLQQSNTDLQKCPGGCYNI